VDAVEWPRRNERMVAMSSFQDRMKKLASELSPEAREIVKKVLTDEHRHRFGDRSNLPEEYATAALQAAKRKETSK
jgi:hypothetical protein